MDGGWIVGRRRTGGVADLLDIGRPANRESLCTPHSFEQTAIGPLRRAVDRACDVRQAHLGRVDGRAFSLFGSGIAETPAGRTHVPEVAADEVALAFVVVQH